MLEDACVTGGIISLQEAKKNVNTKEDMKIGIPSSAMRFGYGYGGGNINIFFYFAMHFRGSRGLQTVVQYGGEKRQKSALAVVLMDPVGKALRTDRVNHGYAKNTEPTAIKQEEQKQSGDGK